MAWWPRFTSHAPLWLYPPIRDALQSSGAETITFAQCALGAETRKFTSIAVAEGLRAHVDTLRSA
eukprot:1795716-Pleurochrysis_carterae.AAC.1